MSSCKAAASWNKLDESPKRYFSCPIMMSDDKILFIPERNDAFNSQFIYIYNTNTNKWIEWIHHTTELVGNHAAAIYNDKIYITNHSGGIMILNTNTNQWNCYGDTQKTGNYPSMVVIQDKIHLIDEGQHHIWNGSNKVFEINHTFEPDTNNATCHGFIYVKSRNVMLLIGGYATVTDLSSDTIYSYDIVSNKWNRLALKLPVPLASFGYVLTRDDRFVIIFGGWTSGDGVETGTTNNIFIIDLHKMNISKSNLQCPINEEFHACIHSNLDKDNFSVYGFVRQCCKFSNIECIPHDLTQIIVRFYVQENIHLFGRYSHWKIDVGKLFE